MWDLRIPILPTKFSLIVTTLTFWTKFPKIERFWPKKKKVNTAIEFCIIEFVLVSRFTLNCQYWQFRPNLPKKGISGRNKKSKQHQWIQHIRISLGVKFHLKLTILTFWTKLSQTGYFRLKTKNVNITIELCIFELV